MRAIGGPVWPDPRIVIHRTRVENGDAFDAMIAWLSERLDPDGFDCDIIEYGQGRDIALLFRIADRRIAIEFGRIFQ